MATRKNEDLAAIRSDLMTQLADLDRKEAAADLDQLNAVHEALTDEAGQALLETLTKARDAMFNPNRKQQLDTIINVLTQGANVVQAFANEAERLMQPPIPLAPPAPQPAPPPPTAP